MPSKDVEMPLSEEDKNLLEEMLDYLKPVFGK